MGLLKAPSQYVARKVASLLTIGESVMPITKTLLSLETDTLLVK